MTQKKHQPKTVELVRSTYQPTKSERDEEFKMDHPGTVKELLSKNW